MYVATGATPPAKTGLKSTSDLPAATRNACKAAAQAGQYVDYLACYDAVRAGAPVPSVSATAPRTETEVAHSQTSLYVGIAIAVAVVGVGGYLLFGRG